MILRILAVSAALSLTVALCRFTVRDVGFVDLGDPGYQCYTLVSEAKSPGGGHRRPVGDIQNEVDLRAMRVEISADVVYHCRRSA